MQYLNYNFLNDVIFNVMFVISKETFELEVMCEANVKFYFVNL
jgi:hypothetical protein